jgi:3-methyl-2-oxobutanoate hydroxymethyltransferase
MPERKKVTLPSLFKMVADNVPITMLTCYDYPTAFFQEQAGIDMILVGDSLGMTMLGYESTLPVTMEDMIRHSQAVRRGSPNAWLIGDMPYMSYQPSVETAIRNAGRFMAEASCDAIKLEGGAEMADRMAGIVKSGIPAMGHLGLTPQSVSALGGFRLQGKGAQQARKIIDDAKSLEEAGAFAILLEMVPDRVCQLITERAKTCFIISLGSGPHAHGQLLIHHDAFGLYRV